MDLEVITNLINDLEKSDPSLSNIRNLSALYTVRNNLKLNEDKTIRELSDILPSYVNYIDVKRKYQMGDKDINIYTYLNNLCTEITEFMTSLYNNTDTPKEREMLQKVIRTLNKL